MATATMIVGGALINAFSFSGTNYLFSKLGDTKEEIMRHNKAMENLAKARQEYEERRMARLDYLNDKLRQAGHAEKTFGDVESAIEEYNRVTGENIENTLGPEPTIDDFYAQPKRDMTEIAVIVVGMLGVYYFAKKFK